jgi:DNA-binding MarR family transcriptional regulator
MISSHLNSSRNAVTKQAVDGRWAGPLGEVLVDVKRTSNARDVRGALLALAYALAEDQATASAVCVLTRSKLSRKRILEEVGQFRAVVRPELGERIALMAMGADGHLFGSLKAVDAAFAAWLAELVAAETTAASAGRSNRQSVMSLLAQLWLRGEGAQKIKSLQEASGASYPTVAQAVKSLSSQGLLEHKSDRRVLLKTPSPEAWLKIARDHGAGRKTLRFADPSGQARPPEAMAQRLFKLQAQGLAKDVAVGGVLGALRHFPGLDITASPRLELSVYGSKLDFLRKLDAALEPAIDAQTKAVLVVHLTPEPASFIDRSADGQWAPELECLADLAELGLGREASEMAAELNRKRQGGTTAKERGQP